MEDTSRISAATSGRFSRMLSRSDFYKDDSSSRRSWHKRFTYLPETDIIALKKGVERDTSNDSVSEATSAQELWSTFSEDSAAILTLQKGGRFRFQQSHLAVEHFQEFMLINSDSTVEEVTTHMLRSWRLPLPKLIVSVISNVDYHSLPHESLLDDLKQGILLSARMTNMWILTDGRNSGTGRFIGEAVAEEQLRQHFGNLAQAETQELGNSGCIAAIGIVSSEQLRYERYIVGEAASMQEDKILELQNIGDDKHELNPQHNYSFILSTTTPEDKEACESFMHSLEARLPKLLALFGQVKDKRSSLSPVESSPSLTDNRDSRPTPVVGLMIGGGPGEIERVLRLLKQNIPVVVIVGKGSATGLLARAYKECLKGDMSRVEQILKPQMMVQLKEAFPDYCGENELLRQQVRDRIIECARLAAQNERELLFLLDPYSPEDDLKDLNKYLLSAIISAQGSAGGSLTREKINWTLKLALRWNREDIVAKKILNRAYISRFRVRDDLFVEALMLPNRESFVDLFLKMGFLLQRLMTYEQVLRLFEASLNEEFFVTICLQTVLLKKKTELGTRFMHELDCDLNKLLLRVSGLSHLVDPAYLLIPPQPTRANSNMLEKKALLTIIYWAVLTNRKNLVKTLWKRSAEPIAVALVISNMYYRMSKYYIRDIDLKVETKKAAIEFGSLAVKIMDLTFNDSRLLAFHSLTNPIPEFNNLNVVDLALISNNIFFIAHPCCQRSMQERWHGNIKIKSYGGLYVPEFLKVGRLLIYAPLRPQA